MESPTSPEQSISAPHWIAHPEAKVLEVSGVDAPKWLQGLLTADLLESPSNSVRSLALDRLGKIRAELIVWRRHDVYQLAIIGGETQQVLEHFRRYIVMEDVELKLVDDLVYSARGIAESSLVDTLRLLGSTPFAPCAWLTANDLVVLVKPDEQAEFRRVLVEQGMSVDGPSFWDRMRIAAGLPAFGVDYDSSDTPGTAGLVEELVSQTKGCYLGQEVVCKMLMRGAIREQVVRMHFAELPESGAVVRLLGDEVPIGTISSATLDRGGGAWAIGRLKASAIESRAKVAVAAIRGEICPRQVGR